MKRKNVTRTLIIADGIEVTKFDELLFSLEKIVEIIPLIKISDYLGDNRNINLDKKR